MSSFADDPGAVLGRLSDAVVVVDDRMAITSANRAALNLIGASTVDEVIGQIGTEWVHEPDRLDAIDRLTSFAAGDNDSSPVSLRLSRFDGSLVWVEIAGAIISDASQPSRVALSLRNVDWRHAADLDASRVVQRSHSLVSAALLVQAIAPEALSEAFDAIVDSVGSAVSADVVVIHEVEPGGGAMALRGRWVAPRVVRSVDKLPTRTVRLDRIPTWVNALNSSTSVVVVANDSPLRAEMAKVEPAIDHGLTFALQPGERLLGAFTVGFASGRKLSSDERDFLDRAAEIIATALHRSRTERASLESESVFLDLFESSSAVMYLVDPVSRRIVDANSSAARFYGYERNRMVGMNLAELTVHSRDELDEMVRGSRSGGGVTVTDQQQELATGEVRTVEIHAAPIRLGTRTLDLAIVQDVTGLRLATARLEQMASTDDLTGSLNRRRFLELVGEEISRSDRYGHELTLLVADLDHFKAINDRWGQAAGDAVLVEFARRCSEFLRTSDQFARMGGEEFAILLPETGIEEAGVIAERIRKATEALTVPRIDQQPVCTVSIGGAEWRKGFDTDELFVHSDRMLHRAKQGGRNRFEA